MAKPTSRMVFTYQNLDGHGWTGLASALAAAGIRPVRAWPMFGDSSSGLHKRANSISWDCVVHCEMADGPLEIAAIDAHAPEVLSQVDTWAATLKEQGHDLAAGDNRNLAYALGMVRVFKVARKHPHRTGSKVLAHQAGN